MPTEVPHSERPGKRRDPLMIFAVALVCRLAVCLWAAERVPPTADGAFYHVVAQRIAGGEGYTWLWPDGAVTYAAHYPVGYPAMMAAVYALFGPHPIWAMVENAVLGAFGVLFCYLLGRHLLYRSSFFVHQRRAANTAGLLLALSPTLLFYTPALMTESSVGALLSLGMWLCVPLSEQRENARLKRSLLLLALGAVVAAACYLRPQSILMAPIFGFVLGRSWPKRVWLSLLVTALAVGFVLPWTVRNCQKMDHCVFVSANGGWNLLIGTFPEGHGAWIGVDGMRVPEACKDVFSESGKDACFGQAGVRRIFEEPLAWAALIPAKLRATFDYASAAAAHLSEAGALRPVSREALQIAELLWQRIYALLALFGAAAQLSPTPRGRFRLAGLILGTFGFVGLGAWFGWLVVAVLAYENEKLRASIIVPCVIWALISNMLIHAVFFGAGRYCIPVWYAVGPLVALGVGRLFSLGARPS